MVNAVIQKEIAKWTFTAVIVADKKASVDMELCHIHMLIYSLEDHFSPFNSSSTQFSASQKSGTMGGLEGS